MTTPKAPNRPPTAASSPLGRIVIVGIAGGSGAGKTWLAQELVQRLRPHAGHLALDDFYRDLASLPASRRERVNFDSPDAIDWELFDACIDRIRSGRPVAIPRYDFATHGRRETPRRWAPRQIVLVEGLWTWTRRAQQRHYTLRIFVDGPSELRLARRLRRDVEERGRTPASIRQQWREHAEPMHALHVQAQAESADASVGAEPSEDDLAQITALLRRLAGLE